MKKILLSLLFVAAATTASVSASALVSDSDSHSVSVSEVSATDWDSILDDYEELIDKLITLSKKVKAGDTSVMTEYTEAASATLSLQKKLNSASSELTTAQATRLAKLALKYAEAL